MAAFGVELLLQTPKHEDEAQITAYITELVAHSNGQQTITQMATFTAEVRQRGGSQVDPQEYKDAFAERLEHMVDARKSAYKRGEINGNSLLVPGAAKFLRVLQERGVACYLASGTDHDLVVEETRLLGLELYFTAIYGARQRRTQPYQGTGSRDNRPAARHPGRAIDRFRGWVRGDRSRSQAGRRRRRCG